MLIEIAMPHAIKFLPEMIEHAHFIAVEDGEIEVEGEPKDDAYKIVKSVYVDLPENSRISRSSLQSFTKLII